VGQSAWPNALRDQIDRLQLGVSDFLHRNRHQITTVPVSEGVAEEAPSPAQFANTGCDSISYSYPVRRFRVSDQRRSPPRAFGPEYMVLSQLTSTRLWDGYLWLSRRIGLTA